MLVISRKISCNADEAGGAPARSCTYRGVAAHVLINVVAFDENHWLDPRKVMPIKGRRAGLSHRSSGVVNVAQFNPWQAHMIVVDPYELDVRRS
jgi:hypothetical protein